MIERRNVFDGVAIGEDMLSMEHITKIYDNGFVANKDVNFSVRKGEIHGLVGENGAGKTTLMKVLFGQEIPEEGRILIAGQPSKVQSPLDALAYGIGMVHQHFMLVNSLTVAENMVLGDEPVKGMLFDRAKARQMTAEVAKQYELDVDPDALVSDLSVGYKQRVEILKMLLRGAKLLLLDEPTAVLTPQETKELFVQLKKLREKGFSIVFISHKLGEVMELCSRVTVLRQGLRLGRYEGTVDVKDVSEADISRMMVGRDVFLNIKKEKAQPKETVLQVRGLNFYNKLGIHTLKDVSFDLRKGEILGVAGVEGNGQSELSDMLAGLLTIQSGEVSICGESIRSKKIREIREMGVSLAHISTLSGGNMQKVVAAREFSAAPKLLLASHPTRGIDVGAAEMIRKKIVALRDEGTATLLFSADLTELLSVSDSIFVMCEGRIVAYFPDASAVDEQVLGEYMLGLKTMSKEEMGGVLHG